MSAIILAIDDSEVDQRLYQRAFKKVDCVLETASSAQAGLARIADTRLKRPDLILLDYNLPDMDGLDFINKLIEDSDTPPPDQIPFLPTSAIPVPIPIVMLTGESNAIVAVEAMKHGVYDYLIKDTEGRYLRLLPGVAGRIMAVHAQREEAQRLRREAENKFCLLFESANDCLVLLSMEGCILDINRIGHERLGYSKEEMLGRCIAEFCTPEFADLLPERVAKIVREGQATVECAHVRKNGSIMPVEVNSRLVELGGEKMLYSVIRDITERKRASLEAHLNQNLLKEAQRLGKLGSWELDLLSGVLRWSDEMYRIFEIDPARFMHTYEGFLGVIHPDDRDKVNQAYTQSLRDRQPYDVVHRLLLPDGRIKWVREHCASDFDVAGKPLRSTGMTQDITERKETEAAILRNEAHLRAMLDNSPYLAWLKDTESRFIMINRALADHFQITDIRDAIGKTDLDFQPRDLAEKYRADDAEVMASGRQKHVEEEAFDGNRKFWVETYKTPIIDAQGNVLGTSGFASDITERKRAEEAKLRVSDLRFRGTLEQVGVGIVYVSLDGQFKQINRKFSEITGYPREELIHKDFQHIIFPDDQDESVHYISELLAGDIPAFTMEKRYVRKDQSLVWVNLTASLLRDIDGTPTYIIGVIEDISERKQTEAIMRQSVAEIEDLYNHAPCGYHSLNQNGDFLMINNTELAWLGYSRNEILFKRNFADLLTPDSLPTFRRTFPQLMKAGEVHDVELNMIRKDGSILPVLINATALYDPKGHFMISRSTVYDMTERKKMEQERMDYLRRLEETSRYLLIAQEDARRRLSSELHDRTSPNLAAIAINLDIITKNLPKRPSANLVERVEDTRALIEDTTTSIREIGNEMRPLLLDYAGLESALASYVNQFARRTGIAVQFECVNCEKRLETNLESMLFRIFQEALTNCSKHAHATSISVTLSIGGQPIVMTITDNGIGFDQAQFGKTGRVGMGLLNMREMAEVAGGSLTIESAVGKGTCITVEMP